MKSILLLALCLVLASSAQIPTNNQQMFLDKADTDQLLDHYHQIDLAPFVPTVKAKEEARSSIVISMVGLINQNSYAHAKELFDSANDRELIKDVVRTAYDGNMLNTMKLIEFMRSLDKKGDQMRGFSELYDEMKRKRDMKNSAIIEIAYWMQQHLEEGDLALETDEYPERFLYYDTEKYSIVSETLARLGEKVSNGDFEEVVYLAKTHPGAMTVVFPRLIREAYSGDIGNFNAVMALAKHEELVQAHKELVLDALLTFMHENNHINTPRFGELKDYIKSSTAMHMLKKKVAIVEQNNAQI